MVSILIVFAILVPFSKSQSGGCVCVCVFLVWELNGYVVSRVRDGRRNMAITRGSGQWLVELTGWGDRNVQALLFYAPLSNAASTLTELPSSN